MSANILHGTMSTFDADGPARVHDRLNDRWFGWRTRDADDYWQYARLGSDNGHCIVYFDGRSLDGWMV